MNKTPNNHSNTSSSATHRVLQKSSTLNRHYVRRPSNLEASNPSPALKIKINQASSRQKHTQSSSKQQVAQATQITQSPQIQHFNIAQSQITSQQQPTPTIRQTFTSTQKAHRATASKQSHHKKSTQQSAQSSIPSSVLKKSADNQPQAKSTAKKSGNARRFLIAFACSATCVAALGFLVYTNMPDLSVKVAALQTGIEAEYPSYIPRDYQLSNVSPDKNGNIIMNFIGPDNSHFTIIEEKSTWDSTALLNNYIKPTYGENYTVLHEQGLTIYLCEADASWVNGGVLYKMSSSDPTLTKKQIKNIATSL